jgi:2-iminobutanoate/2-iminopropanoate deaminase
MAAIKHFAAPAGMTTPPLSFATGTGDLLFVSGIAGFDENASGGFRGAVRFCVRNIKRVLDESGRELSRSGQGQRAAEAPLLREQ